MNYVLRGHNYVDDVVSIIMMFYPNDKYIQTAEVTGRVTVVSELENMKAGGLLYIDGELRAEACAVAENDSQREIKRVIGLSIAKAVNSLLNISLPWGILTGVRPAKLVSEAWAEGQTTDEIRKTFKEKYLVSDEKLDLMIKVAEEEKRSLKVV